MSRNLSKSWTFLACFLLALTLTVCGGGGGGTGGGGNPPPTITISAPSPVTAGDARTASVTTVSGATYAWSIVNGTITGGGATPVVSFTAGAPGTTQLKCNVNGTQAIANISVLALPVISSFTATPPTLTTGSSAQLAATFSGGTGNIQPGNLAITSGTPITVTPSADTTYTLTATNAAGGSATSTVTVHVVPPPVVPVITAPSSAPSDTAGLVASTPVQAGCTYLWSISGGTITAGGTSNAISFMAGAAGTLTLSCTVTNAAGATAAGTASVDVLAALPVISAFSASPSAVIQGGSSTLSATFSNGTGTVDHGIGAVSSGVPISTGALNATTTFTLTVNDGHGHTTTSTTTVTVTSLPAITDFSASPSTISPGGTAMLTATFINGTGTVDHSVGAVSSGVPISTGTLNATTTFTITVSDGLGHTATATTTVTVATLPSISGFGASPAVIAPGGSTMLTATFSNGTGTVDHGIGAVSSGVPISTGPLAATTTFTLTVSDGLGHTATATTTVTVTSLPTILSFTASPRVIRQGDSAMLTATFINLTNDGLGNVSVSGLNAETVASGVPFSTGALNTTTTFILTLTSDSGYKATAAVTVVVTNLPTIASYSASPTLIRPGDSSTLSATFINGTGTVDHGIGAVSSGVPISTGPLNATTTFTLTVKDSTGSLITTAPMTVVVATLPTLAGFSASPMSVPPGASAMLSATFANGSGTVDQGIGPVFSGVPFSTGVLNATTTFTITVDDGAGHTTTASTTVMVSSGSYSGTFVATGTPSGVRSYYTATLLSNGKVLVAGGALGSSLSTNQAELYDPSTGAFTGTGTLVTPRINSTAVRLLDGKVLLAGGSDYTSGTANDLSSVELYDPATGAFSSTGSMGNRRHLASAILLQNGKVLVAGGLFSGTFLSSAELYDPATGLFTPTGSMGQARSQPSLTLLLDGTVLVTGGGGTSTYDPSKTEIYDPNTGVFSPTIGPMNVGRDGDSQAALLPDGKVLISGGGQYQDFNSTPPEVYDPASGTFWIVQPLIDWRTFSGSWSTPLLPNGKVLVCGGGGPYYVVGPLTSAELYDPVTATFSSTGSMLTKRTGGTVTLLSDGRVLVMGGTTTNVPAELYQ